MDATLRDALATTLDSPVRAARSLAGGDINDAYAVELQDGRSLFVKTHPRAPEGMFGCEARGLAWLAQANALRVPQVLGYVDRGAATANDSAPAYLALELLESAPRVRDFDERLGRGLAALHVASAETFGFAEDNFIGCLPQTNRPSPNWSEFYASRRLEPQLQRAQDAGRASAHMQRGFRRLWAQLDTLVGPPEAPARLHGDLWSGNLHVDDRGEPCLIDPAVYAGHREIDLAMMQLFGGFGPRVFASYDEAYPRCPGHESRVKLYQLYPLLVHVNLFGGSYVRSVEAALDALV